MRKFDPRSYIRRQGIEDRRHVGQKPQITAGYILSGYSLFGW